MLKYKLYIYLITFLLSIKQYFLISLVWTLSTKKISYAQSNKKNIFIIPKSGGINDLINDLNKDDYNENKINIYSFNRYFFIPIWNNFSTKYNLIDIKNKSKDNKNALLFRDALLNIMKYYIKFNKIDLLITFNFYDLEFELLETFKILEIKILIYFKESLKSKNNWNEMTKIYQQNFYSFKDYRYFFMAVYTNEAMNAFIKANLVNEKNIAIVGCGRLDYSFRLNTNKEVYFKSRNKKFKIIYYLIQNTACLPVFNGNLYRDNKIIDIKKYDWSNLSNRANKFIIEFAKKNKNVEIILKSKVGFELDQLKDFKNNLPKNCKIIKGGVGHNLLKEADVVIGFNSSALFESIAACIPTISLNFSDSYHDYLNKFHLDNSGIINHVKNELQLEDNLINIMQNNIKKNDINKNERNLLKYYFGNDNGKASSEIVTYIEKIIN